LLCPSCKTPLSMADRSGIEIDYCPTCRGVWLDRGELDKIIERSAGAAPASNPPPRVPEAVDYRRDAHHGHSYGQGHHYPRKKKSFLSEVFDFD
jgi:uncharacterized protein